MKGDLIIGLEIEMEYNRELIGYIDDSSYHSDSSTKFSERFIAESDGSLRARKFRNGDVVELISVPVNINDYDGLLEEFKNEIYRRVAQYKEITLEQAETTYKMKDLISFNSTMGSHIHFSFLREDGTQTRINLRDKVLTFPGSFFPINSKINYNILKEIRERIKDDVKKTYPNGHATWLKNYNRSYAREQGRLLNKSNRTMEFNLTLDSNRIEFRSFNLNGVSTWEKMSDMYSIALSHIQAVFKSELRRKSAFEEKFSISIEQKNLKTKKTTITENIMVRPLMEG